MLVVSRYWLKPGELVLQTRSRKYATPGRYPTQTFMFEFEVFSADTWNGPWALIYTLQCLLNYYKHWVISFTTFLWAAGVNLYIVCYPSVWQWGTWTPLWFTTARGSNVESDVHPAPDTSWKRTSFDYLRHDAYRHIPKGYWQPQIPLLWSRKSDFVQFISSWSVAWIGSCPIGNL